jgi:glutathione S-transferase
MSLISYYLPLRARAEAPRMMLTVGKIPFLTKDIPFTEWAILKKTGTICHFGQLPSVKLPNGPIISQSGAVCRYIAKLAGLYPQDPVAAAEADMVFELAQEMAIINPVANYYQIDSADWKQNYDNFFARFPRRMIAAQKILGDKDFFGGVDPNYSDFGLFHICDITRIVQPKALDTFPQIIAWCERMNAIPGVRAYIASRPGPSTPGWGIPGTTIMSGQ